MNRSIKDLGTLSQAIPIVYRIVIRFYAKTYDLSEHNILHKIVLAVRDLDIGFKKYHLDHFLLLNPDLQKEDKTLQIIFYYADKYKMQPDFILQKLLFLFCSSDTEFKLDDFIEYIDSEIIPSFTEIETKPIQDQLDLYFSAPNQIPEYTPSVCPYLDTLTNPLQEHIDIDFIIDKYYTKIKNYRFKKHPFGGQKTALRGVHPRSYGVLEGEFIIKEFDEKTNEYNFLEKDLRTGIFSDLSKNYKAILRFSGSGGGAFEVLEDDNKLQVHGLGMKLLDTKGNTVQDFLLNNTPVFPTNNPKLFVPGDTLDINQEAVQLFENHKDEDQVLLMNYYSISAFSWGTDRAVKYSLRNSFKVENLLSSKNYIKVSF